MDRNSGFGSDNWRVRSNDVADSAGNDKIGEKDDGGVDCRSRKESAVKKTTGLKSNKDSLGCPI